MVLDIADPKFDAEELFNQFRDWLVRVASTEYAVCKNIYKCEFSGEYISFKDLEPIKHWIYHTNAMRYWPKEDFNEEASLLINIWLKAGLFTKYIITKFPSNTYNIELLQENSYAFRYCRS